MVDLAERSILLLELFKISDLELMNSFDGDSLEREPVLGSVHHSEASRAHLLFEVILLLDISLPCTHEHALLNDNVLVDPLVDKIYLLVLL